MATFRWLGVSALVLLSCADPTSPSAALYSVAPGDVGAPATDAAPNVSQADGLNPSDTSAPDASRSDADAPGDASAEDAGQDGAGEDGTGAEDAGVDDAGAQDAGIEDAVKDDAGAQDAGTDDAAIEDSGAPDAGLDDVLVDGDASPADDTGSPLDDTGSPLADTGDLTTDATDADVSDDVPWIPEALCSTRTLTPWSRKHRGAGGTVVFSELMVTGASEWIELHNPMAVAVDLSGWRLAGVVQTTFPEGTVLEAGSYWVVSTFVGGLPDEGGLVELRSNADRLMDRIDYRDAEPWPVAPFGAGSSLAKRRPDAWSEPAESWSDGPPGGTPGQANWPTPASPTVAQLLPLDATWRYDMAGDPAPAGWELAGFDDSTWAAGAAPFSAGLAPPESQPATAVFTADNFFALYVGKADGTDLRLVGRDAVSDWTTPESFSFEVAPDDHLFVAAWEAKTGDGGPQMLIGQVSLGQGSLGAAPALSTETQTFEWVLGDEGASPGGDIGAAAPALGALTTLIEDTDTDGLWATSAVSLPRSASPWGYAVAGSFADATRFVWPDTFDAVSVTNTEQTFVLYRSVSPIVPTSGTTELPGPPITTRFRVDLGELDPNITALWMSLLVDDGARVTLNGVEVLRQNLPDGALAPDTLASEAVDPAEPAAGYVLPVTALQPGHNVLAVEVHQASAGPGEDLRFAATLHAEITPPTTAQVPGLIISEVTSDWVEVFNPGATTITIDDYTLRTVGPSGQHDTPLPDSVLVANDRTIWPVDLSQAQKLYLLKQGEPARIDGVRVANLPLGRDTQGIWRALDQMSPGQPNPILLHDEVVISELMYHHSPVEQAGGPVASDEEWIELANRSDQAVDLSGWQLVDAVEYVIPQGVVLAPGAYLVIARDAAALAALYPTITILGDYDGGLANSGERVVLRDACGNTVDEVAYLDGGRWPEAAGGSGSSLERRDLRADGAVPEAWAASLPPTTAWEQVVVEGVVAPSAVGPDGQWSEFVLGLLDDGVALVDDLSVVEDPAGAALELIQDGGFDNPTSYRLLGNHRRSAVIDDPDQPGNRVLRVVATGPTEHMHNHVETTLAGGESVENGVAYRISFRARWVSGNNLLNTRLYFNRLAQTTTLPRSAALGTPGAPNSTLVANLGPTVSALSHTPAVPAPYQPVTVTATAADPDGVAQVWLWTSIAGAGGGWVPMVAAGDGHFSAVVPGQPAGAVVQLYVQATDTLGNEALFPAGGPTSRALWQVDDGLASTTGLQNLRLILTDEDKAWLFDPPNLMSNDLVGATVVMNEHEVFYDVGVRMKGSERGRPEPARVGFAVRFDADHLLRGVYSGANVDRSEGVGYGQREVLINTVTAHAGSLSTQYDDLVQLIAPRSDVTGPASLQLARFGDLFLENQFDDGGNGALFEYELIYYPSKTDDGTPQGLKVPKPDSVVGTPIRDLGDDKEAYRLNFIIKNKRWRDDYTRFIAFAKVFGQSGEAFETQVDSVADVDEWLRAFAFATLSGAVDNYASGAQHNGELYVRPSDQRVLYFPHDLDFYGGSTQSPLVNNNDLAKLLAVPLNKRRYYGHLNDILSSSYNGTYIQPWCERFAALLPNQPFASHCAFIAERSTWATAQVLATIPQVPFAITTPPGPVAAGLVTLVGTGWIDVAQVRRSGLPLPITWTSATTWQATVKVLCGESAITLEARDRDNGVLGTASVTLIGTGDDCE